MALTNQKSTPSFEAPDDENVIENGATDTRSAAQARLAEAAAQHAAAKPADDVKPSASRDVATQSAKAGQVAVAKPMVNPLAPLKDAFTVEWDTLRSLKLTNGNLVDNQTGKSLGGSFGLELLSYQDQWVISPGGDDKDKEASKEHVRYSTDGITTTQGDDCNDYLAQLKKSGYPEAKMTKRMVICGSLFDLGEKGRKAVPELQDCLVQVSLPPTSKATFDRYMLDQAFKVGKGILDAAGSERIQIECEPVSKGDRDWTVANFSRYGAPAA
jgi:hypothetical protein